MDWQLRANEHYRGPRGPVVLVILDGVGIGNGDESDAVARAPTPTLDALFAEPGASCQLTAHGPAVGLPSADDIGNSEVGHNALGCGKIHAQGALLINRAIASGALFQGEAWRDIMERCRTRESALHFLGILSDGNVHSHIDHLIAMLRRAAADGVDRLYVHALLDGRDVPPTSALEYVDRIEAVLAELRTDTRTARVASGGGRMTITLDRYEADWPMVERGYQIHVHGRGRQFSSLRQAVETLRQEDPGVGDQSLPGFVIADNGKPVAPIRDGDAVINFHFRGDRAIEISRAFEDQDFPYFDRGDRPDVLYAGMMLYDGDTLVPKHYLVDPPAIDHTMGEYLVRNRVPQLAISETQKYGHVTYFWNGNHSGKFDDAYETYIEIPSYPEPFQNRPWMRAAEITDRLIEELKTGRHRFVRVNYANGDMIGHTGSLQATIVAMQVLDLQLARLRAAVDALGGILIVTADHGNADEMYQHAKDGSILRDSASGLPVVRTSHTLNPVPFMIHDAQRDDHYTVRVPGERAGIANVTATCFELLGFVPPEGLEPSLLRFEP